jgi:hypothetical protein
VLFAWNGHGFVMCRADVLRLAPCIFFDAALTRGIHRLPLITIAQQVGVGGD